MLAFERIGAGPPLVLLHGVAHRRQAWYPVVDRLADQRELILVDLPGHGESDPLVTGPGASVVDVLRVELLSFFDQQGLDRPHVAGNSLGGRIALEVGALGRARTVTALSPAGFWRSAAAFAYTRAVFVLAATISRRLDTRAARLCRTRLGRALMFGWITARPMGLDPDRALGDYRAFTAALPALAAVLQVATPFTSPIAEDVPVTIAWGSRDLLLLPYQARVARAALPWARHVRLPGCGHVPMSDDPALVAEVLLAGSAEPVSLPPPPVPGSARRPGRTPSP